MNRPLLPREKIAQIGLANATERDLLAVLLGSGNQNQSVYQLVEQLLKKSSLSQLANTSLAELMQVVGIGPTQAHRILASAELGKRMHTTPEQPVIMTSSDVLRHVAEIRHKKREHCLALYLNARQELLQKETVSIGGLNYANLAPRDLFGLAVTLPAAYLILVHNHPSGNTQPSQDDLEITERLYAAGQLLGISILDHLIVSYHRYFSFREEGML